MTLLEKVFAVIGAFALLWLIGDIIRLRRLARHYREIARKDRERFASWFPDG